jgi:hypothetical protein
MDMMKAFTFIAFVVLAGCDSDWRGRAIGQAEDLVRDQLKDPALTFSRVQFTGDSRSGQTCGYALVRPPGGGEVPTRFIAFIDGAGGQNPFIDSPSAPYPANKDDFAPNWRTQCLDLGYKEP